MEHDEDRREDAIAPPPDDDDDPLKGFGTQKQEKGWDPPTERRDRPNEHSERE